MSIDLRILEDDLTTEVAVLDVESGRHGLEWVDSVLDQGGANFNIPHTSPAVQANPDLFVEGNVIQIRDDGTPLFAFEVERPRRDAGNVSDRIAITGPGALSLLDHALVKLPTEQARLRNRQRVFGWMSTDFDASTWDSPIPYSGGTQADPDRVNRRNRPTEWADADAEWLWSSAVDGSGNHPVGNSYFRWELDANTLGPGAYLLDVAGDNVFVAYFDGEQVADGDDWRGFATVEVELVAGVTHVLAVEVRNTRQSGGIMWSLAEFVDDDEERGDVVARSGDTVGRSIDYPAEVPGVTHGFVLKTLFDEAQARGAINALSIDFDEDVDSDGEPWADEIEMTLQAGNDTLLTAADRMRDWPIEFRMDPATWTFQAFQRAGVDRGQTPDVGLSTVTIPKGRAKGRSWEADGKTYDVLLVETQFDWAEVDDGSPPATNRREGFLSLAQSPTLSLALKQAEKVRQLYATRREQVTFQTSSGTPGPQPYDEYGVGDVIECPTLDEVTDADWTAGDLRVDTVTATLTRGGHVTWTHQAVDARIRSTLERLLTSREALGDGTLGGRTKVSTAPIGDGRGSAQASRKSDGGAADPRTITVEAEFVDIEPGGTLIPWQRETSPYHSFRVELPTLPDPEVPWPASAIVSPRVEMEWDHTELEPEVTPSDVTYPFRGGGDVTLRVNGLFAWPLGDGLTEPTAREGIHRRFESVMPALLLLQGDRVTVELDHGDEEARLLARALLTLTLVEPLDAGEASSAPGETDVDELGGDPDAVCTNGPSLWVRFRGGDDDAENLLADYLDGDGNLCAPGAVHSGEPFIATDGPYGDASYAAENPDGQFSNSGSRQYQRNSMTNVATMIARVRVDSHTGSGSNGWLVAPTGASGAASGESPAMGLQRRSPSGADVRYRSVNYPVPIPADGGYHMIGVTLEGDSSGGRIVIYVDGKLTHDEPVDNANPPDPGNWRFFRGVDTFGGSFQPVRFSGIAEVAAWPDSRRLTRLELGAAMASLAREGVLA